MWLQQRWISSASVVGYVKEGKDHQQSQSRQVDPTRSMGCHFISAV